LLRKLVEEFGAKDWSTIAAQMRSVGCIRMGKQCRERWFNHLSPDVRKDAWTAKEDQIIIKAHSELGNKWTEISRRLNGRPANAIKNHWNSTLKRRLGKNGEYRKKFKFDTAEDDHDDHDDPDTDDPLNDSIPDDKSLSSLNRYTSTKEVGEQKKEELSADESEPEFSVEEQNTTVDDSPVPRIPQNHRPSSEEDCEIESLDSPVIKKRKHGHDEGSKTESIETVLSSPSQISKFSRISYPSTQYTLLFDMEEDTIPFFVDTLTEEEFPSFDEIPISIDPLQNQNDCSNWSLDCYDLYRPDVNSVFNGWWLQQDTPKDPLDNTIL